MRRFPLGAVLLTAVVALAAPAPAAAAFDERPCAASGFRCTTVAVPLDRDAPGGGRIGLDVRRLPTADAPTATAFVVLLGGPGQAGTPHARELADAVGTARGARDLIVFDPRGVGRSGGLRCRATDPRACARELGSDRGAYTTADDVADLEAIRTAGGYERLVLYGTSYGTKVALRYAAGHPERVERLVLDSVVGPEGPDPLQLSFYAAVRRALPALCAGSACTRPLRSLDRLLGRLDRRTLRSRVATGTGPRVRVRVTAREIVHILLSGDRNPVIRAETPAAIAAAAHGDDAALARLAARSRGIGGIAWPEASDGINTIRNVTTICEELPFPWRRQAGPRGRLRDLIAHVRTVPRARFAPFSRETLLTAGVAPMCLRWPAASPAPPRRVDLPTGIPALLLAGAQDLRTPVEDAREVAARLGPAARLVIVPHVGHSVLGSDPSGCAAAALAAFMGDGRVAACRNGDPLIEPPGMPARSLAAVPPYRGVPGLPGRTLAATSRTVADALRADASALIEDTGHRFAGLRGGTATRTGAGLRLRRYSYIRGVTLTGLVPATDGRPIRIVVGGRRAARGRFTVAGGRIDGRLGGRRIDVVASPPAARAAAARSATAVQAPHPGLARVP